MKSGQKRGLVTTIPQRFQDGKITFIDQDEMAHVLSDAPGIFVGLPIQLFLRKFTEGTLEIIGNLIYLCDPFIHGLLRACYLLNNCHV